MNKKISRRRTVTHNRLANAMRAMLGLTIIAGLLILLNHFMPRPKSLDDLTRRCDKHLQVLLGELARNNPLDADRQVVSAMVALGKELIAAGYASKPPADDEWAWLRQVNDRWLLPNHQTLWWSSAGEPRLVRFCQCVEDQERKINGQSVPVHILGASRYPSHPSWNANPGGSYYGDVKPAVLVFRTMIQEWVGGENEFPGPMTAATWPITNWSAAVQKLQAEHDTADLAGEIARYLCRTYWMRTPGNTASIYELTALRLERNIIRHELAHIEFQKLLAPDCDEVFPVLSELQDGPAALALFGIMSHISSDSDHAHYAPPIILLVDTYAREPRIARHPILGPVVQEYLRRDGDKSWTQIKDLHVILLISLIEEPDIVIHQVAKRAYQRALVDIVPLDS